MQSPWIQRIGVTATAVVLAGCSVAGPSVGPLRSPSAPPAAIAATTADPCPRTDPIADASLPADLDDATREGVRFRTDNGLRRDLEWIRDVAADPTMSTAFGTPLLPAEEATLFARNSLPDPVLRALGGYGHIDEFGGLYIDNAEVRVVTLWTTDPEVHEAAIRPLLPACHPVAFLQVRWSERELRAWQDRVAADVDWMAEIPAQAVGIGADIRENVMTIDVSSANPGAAEVIVAHYDAPAGMIRVTSDGTGAHLLPSGTVVGRVLLADGSPPGPNDLMLDSGSPDDAPGWCGGGDIGYGVMENGTIDFPCKVGRRTILVRDWVANERGEHPVVASVVVEVPAGGQVEVEIRLPQGFDPAATA